MDLRGNTHLSACGTATIRNSIFSVDFQSAISGWLSFPVTAALAFACMVYLWIPPTIADPDIWWHLRNAQSLIASHTFLTHDTLSFTAAGSPWINHEWLSELPFYFGWRIFGDRGILLVTIAAIETTLLGVFYIAYQKSRSVTATLIASLLAATCATISFGPRTLLFGWICLVAELIIFLKIPKNLHWIWTLPPLFAFWINLHGSWLIGITLFISFVVCGQIPVKSGLVASVPHSGRQSGRLLISLGLTLGALFVNPYGWRLVRYPFDLAYKQTINIETIEEWKTLDFHSTRAKVFLVAVAMMFLLTIIRQLSWSLYELVLAVTGIYAAVTYSRFLFLGGILLMPIFARLLASILPADNHKPVSLSSLILLCFTAPLLSNHFPSRESIKALQKGFPVQAIDFLQTFYPSGHVFNDFRWGGFLEWNARQIPTFIDSRVDIFEYNGTFRDYLDIVQIGDPLLILKKYNIHYVLFERNTPLTYLLEHDIHWRLDYQDDTTDLLERVLP